MGSLNSTLKLFHYPKSVPEACSLLREDEGAKIIAGGTALALTKLQKVHALVDISRLGLEYIKTETDGKHIGATTSAQTLATSVTLRQIAGGILSTAAAGIGSRPIRNQVTIGGNVVQLYPWSDLPAALIALDATVKIAPNGPPRRGGD